MTRPLRRVPRVVVHELSHELVAGEKVGQRAGHKDLEEPVGFEPTNRLRGFHLSRVAKSTALPRLHVSIYVLFKTR